MPLVEFKTKRHSSCTLSDNLRLFRNAVGFVAPHGMDFANIGFIENVNSTIIQLVPPRPNPYSRQIDLHEVNAYSLGHTFMNVVVSSSGPPSWDLTFSKEMFLRQTCKAHDLFKSWLPTREWFTNCATTLAS